MLTSLCLCLQSRHRHNGDRRLEVNDPVPSSLGSWSLPCPGFCTVPTLWSSEEAPKTVLTARLCSWTIKKGVKHGFFLQRKGLVSVPLFYFHQNWTHLNKEEWSFLTRDVGGRLAHGSLTSVDWKTIDSIGVACFAAPAELCLVRAASQVLFYIFFSCNFQNGLNISAIALELL